MLRDACGRVRCVWWEAWDELAGLTGAECVRGVLWPTASEVLGGTHSRQGLCKGLEPPHTQPAQMGAVQSL